MGISGLWEFIKDAGQQRSFAHLAIKDGFEDNTSSRRAYRIGINVSTWLRHSYSSKGGENPQLQMLFFRLSRLAEHPLIPLFVFDGRQCLKVKRGSKIGESSSHPLSQAFKEMIEAFGMEFRVALGEAEAELAYLNSKGYIDAILTDDCVAFVFGGRTIIKNWSATLSGDMSDAVAQRHIGSNTRPQVTVYSADRIRDLSRGGFILYALLQGGDYHEGVPGFGPAHSFGLAKCGFGDSLLKEYKTKGKQILPFLEKWREEMNVVLASNSGTFIPKSKHKIPETFPDLKVLEFYVNPISSGGGPPLDKGEMNLPNLAKFCEMYFEWAYSQSLIKRFRDLLWPGAVMHILRRAALEADTKEREKRARSGNEDCVIRGALKPSRAEAVGTPAALVKQYLPSLNQPSKEDRPARIAGAYVNRSQTSQVPPCREGIQDPHPLITRVVGTRNRDSIDSLLEYGVEVCPVQLVALTKEGIKGFRGPPKEPKKPARKPPPAPDSILRLWIPGSVLHQVHPGLVEEYAMKEGENVKKEPKERGKRKADDDYEGRETRPALAAPRVTQVARRKQAAAEPIASLTAPRAHPAPLTREEGTNVIDPRFIATGDGMHNECFLLTHPNPDEYEDLEDGEESAPAPVVQNVCLLLGLSTDQDDMVVDKEECEGEDDPPLDAHGQNIRPKLKHKAPGQSKDSIAPTLTRIHQDDDLLTRLDKLDAGRVVKRRKIGAA